MYAETGAHASARRTLEQALEIERATLGPVHPMIALTLSSLAHHYITQHEMDTAEPLIRESLEIRRRIFGNAHPEVARALDILGAMFLYKDELDEAERCCSEALEILRHSFPPTHPEIARSLNNLASIHHRRGSLAIAEKLQKEALDIWIGARGEEHPGLFIPFSNLSGIAAAQKRYDEAFEWMQRLEALNDLIVIRTLPGSSEYRCLGWLDSMRVSMEGVLSLVIQKRMHSPAAVRIACDLVLRRKAIVFEVLARQRATVRYQGSHVSRAMNELFEQRRRLSEESLADPSLGGVEEHRRKIVALESVVEELESQIARTAPAAGLERRLRHANRASIAARLDHDAALVELIRFDVVNFDAVAPQKYWAAPRYAAFVIRGAKPDDVVLLDLGDANEIDRKIDTFRTWIQRLSSSTDPERNGTLLREAVFDPILRAAPDCKRLFIAPDGTFNRLPFETLPEPSGEFVLDTHHISYVVAGRDLAEPTPGTRPRRVRAPLVAADPDFELGVDTDAPMRRREGDFDALPGARTEDRSRGGSWRGAAPRRSGPQGNDRTLSQSGNPAPGDARFLLARSSNLKARANRDDDDGRPRRQFVVPCRAGESSASIRTRTRGSQPCSPRTAVTSRRRQRCAAGRRRPGARSSRNGARRAVRVRVGSRRYSRQRRRLRLTTYVSPCGRANIDHQPMARS
jgi:tetratricopeptide (TPR) repeat protein